MDLSRGEIVIYESAELGARVEGWLEHETVWLDAHQMADLFQRDRSAILMHIRNIYTTGELNQESTCAKFAHVAKDGKNRLMDLYNLDVIMGVGYRANSRLGTEFRVWASNVLRDHIIKGYTINQKRLLE